MGAFKYYINALGAVCVTVWEDYCYTCYSLASGWPAGILPFGLWKLGWEGRVIVNYMCIITEYI